MIPKKLQSIAEVATCVRMDDACPRYIEPETWPPNAESRPELHGFLRLGRAGEAGVQGHEDPRSGPHEGAAATLLGPDPPRQVAKAIQAVPKRFQACIASRGSRFEHRLQ